MAVLAASDVRSGWLPGVAGAATDTLLGALITTADDRLSRWCGHLPASAGGVATFEDVAVTLYLRGDGSEAIALPWGPLVSVTSIYDDPHRVYGADTLVSSGDYDAVADEARVLLKASNGHGAWSDGYARALKVACTLGYTTVPQPIKDAVGLTVAHWYREREREGLSSMAQGGVNVSLREYEIPPIALTMLAPYRWWRQGWA